MMIPKRCAVRDSGNPKYMVSIIYIYMIIIFIC